MTQVLRVAYAVVLALMLGACASNQAQQDQGRMAGQVIDDATLTAKVKTQIAKAQGVGDALGINVDTYRGVVSLAGFVNDRSQMQAAVDAARQVQGVRDVKNNLQLKPAS